jgi:hypothetical protein
LRQQLNPVSLKPAPTARILVVEANEKDASNPGRVKLFITAGK